MDFTQITHVIEFNRKLIIQTWFVISFSTIIIGQLHSIYLIFMADLLLGIVAVWMVSEGKVPPIQLGKILDNINHTHYQGITEQDVMNLKNNEQDFELRLDSHSVSLIRRE